uniref:Uncharacterized protein n=1 Tax=Plectus sambesii TaxID=2011161 RepID=A0A914UL54_9BILA
MFDRRRFALQLAVVSLFAVIPSTRSVAIDNGLLGEPEVQCGASTVEMQFRTKKMFTESSTKSLRDQQSALQRYLMRSNGAIVSDVQGVCLSSLTFAILMGSLALVVVAVAFVAASVCCHRMRAVLRSTTDGKLPQADTLWGVLQRN